MASFTVYDLSDGAPVGTAGLMSIDWRLSRATFGITIGERRGTGERVRQPGAGGAPLS
jgi:hypothetical protein